MSELKPLSGDKTLYKLITDNKTVEYDKIKPKGNNSGGNNMNDFIKRDEFENFKTHLDSKFDRLIDKLDENRRELKDDMKHQTMVTISVISAIITVVGVLVPVILHFI
ncbi:hypothetical protein PYH66_13695 (plasmid) [Staphylococcus delphini]|uniref:hypothetical protein n=1 Tax=Staphylococcus delphini TaxID=53344 RepID=UPI0033650A9C